MRARTHILALALLAFSSACSDEPTDETPEGAVVLFVKAMERSGREPDYLRVAYELLCGVTQRVSMRVV